MKKTAKRIIKIFIITAAAVLVLAAGGAAALRYFLSEDKIKSMITSEVMDSMNRLLIIGDLRYGFGKVVLSDTELYDGKTEADQILLQAKRISLGFSLFDLVKQELRISNISITDLKLNIVFDKKNITNLEKIAEELSSEEEDSSSSIKTDVSFISLENAEINVIGASGYWEPLAGSYRITTGIDLSDKEIIRLKNCSLDMPETRGHMDPELSITIKDESVLIFGDVDLKNASLLWVYKWAPVPDPVPYDRLNGKVKDLSINITKENNIIVGGHVISSSTLTGSPFIINADGFCEVNVDRETIHLWDVNAKVESSSLLLKDLLLDFDINLKNFSAQNVNAAYRHLQGVLQFMPKNVSADLKGNLSFAGGKYYGDLTVSRCGFMAAEGLITDLNTRVQIKDSRFRLENTPVKILGSPCTVSLTTMDDSFSSFFADIKCSEMIIPKEEQDSKEKKSSVKKTSSFKTDCSFTLNGRADIGTLKYGDLSFSRLSASFGYSGDVLSVKKISADFLQGRINAAGKISLSEKKPDASVNAEFDRINLQMLTSKFADVNEHIYGTVSGSGKISGLLTDDLLSSLRGDISFEVKKGKIADTGIQNGLGIFLSELKYKLKDLEFNRITGSIGIMGQELAINSFVFSAENIVLKMQGDISTDLVSKNMDIILEFTPDFIQDIPAVGLGLRSRKQGNWYSIPFTATGNITDSSNLTMH